MRCQDKSWISSFLNSTSTCRKPQPEYSPSAIWNALLWIYGTALGGHSTSLAPDELNLYGEWERDFRSFIVGSPIIGTVSRQTSPGLLGWRTTRQVVQGVCSRLPLAKRLHIKPCKHFGRYGNLDKSDLQRCALFGICPRVYRNHMGVGTGRESL